jgi:hypothetical protein
MGGMAVPSAKAADLGGDCCADLEERVAELEATTARKGNRKMSLTVSGQVNRTIMYWNDGGRSNTFFGADSHVSSTRFGFSGNAKISPSLSAGYSILIDVADKARTSRVSQVQEDGTTEALGSNRNGDHLIRMRDANVWLENKTAGRLTLGRITNSGQSGFIDLGGTSAVTASDPACMGGGFAFRPAAGGAVTATTISSLSYGCTGAIGIRMDGIKYTSPAFMGFIFDASIGEALKVETSTVDDPSNNVLTNVGRVMGVNLKYAGEFNGFRIAAGVGAEWAKANENDAGSSSDIDGVLSAGGGTAGSPLGVKGSNASMDSVYWAAALSLMHVPSGLFVHGDYLKTDMAAQNPVTGLFSSDREATRWNIQGGIAKNWFGFGNTVLFGEYGLHKNFKFAKTGFTSTGDCNGGAGSVGTVPCTVDVVDADSAFARGGSPGDKLTFFGMGAVQNIDAAAMEVYINWRRFSATDGATKLDDIDLVTAGARVKF